MWREDRFCNRDVPLRFRHRASDAIIERLGLPAPKNKNRADARASIVGETLLAHAEGHSVSFSRRRAYYSERRRYFGPCGTFANVLAEVGLLVEAGLIIEQRARSGSRGHQSTIRASAALVEAIPPSMDSDFSFHVNEIIVLRNELPNGRRETLDYFETAETRAMRRQLSRINHDYAALKLVLPCAEKVGSHWMLDGRLIRITPLVLRRIFNRGRWDCGGRAYGQFQQLPKLVRSQLLLESHPVCEPDYSAIHPHLIYADRDLRLVGDPYDLEGFERSQCKLAFNVAINSKSTNATIGALVHDQQMTREQAKKILHELKFKHRLIADIFCSDAGVRFMKLDSELILAVTVRCLDLGIAALPVHDSLIVPEAYGQIAAGIMVDEFGRRYPRANPCEVKINHEKVSQIGPRPLI
jgi:hypothetical protein